jgi:hypothetical protein
MKSLPRTISNNVDAINSSTKQAELAQSPVSFYWLIPSSNENSLLAAQSTPWSQAEGSKLERSESCPLRRYSSYTTGKSTRHSFAEMSCYAKKFP